MGIVYRAYDSELGTEVALKTLRNLAPDEILRMKREFRSLANLSHPNLVVLHELFCEDGFWFFTMELVRGLNFSSYVNEGFRLDQADTRRPGSTARARSQLKRWPTAASDDDAGTLDSGVTAKSIYRRGLTTEPQFQQVAHEQAITEATSDPVSTVDTASPRANEPSSSSAASGFNEERLRAALRQLVLGVRALHAEGKRHRDLKPDNVMVTPEGRVVILDFGLVSSRLSDESNPDEDATAGTPAYMAPEQMWGAAPTEASDWYSVGVMLFEALTGRWPRMPSVGASLEPLAQGPGVPADLAQLCAALLNADPSKRPSGDEILARISHAPVSSSTPTPSVGMFFGRQQHLETLHTAFAALRQRQSIVVQVRGSSGFGKTTLVRQFLRSVVETNDALVIEGRCYERETVPHKVFDSLLDSLRGHLLRLPRADAMALLPRDVGLLARVFPVLRTIDSIAEEPRPDTDVQDPQELIRRASLALKELLVNLSRSRPVVLFVDDLQWGDVDSARLLREVLATPVIPGLMVLVSYRLEETNNPTLKALLKIVDSTSEGQLPFAVDVGPLERAAAREMIRSLLQGSPAIAQIADQHHVDSMIDESEGNPFLLHEFAQHLSSGQDATGVALEDVVRRRVALLPTSARILLETVAVAGQPISQALALGAAGLSPDSDALQVLRTSHLVRTGGARRADSVECYHDRIREAVAELPEGRLRSCHRRLAEAIERSSDADIEALATHWERAGEPRRGVHYARLAATKAALALAFDHAANLYARVLRQTGAADAERPQLLAALGDTLRNANRGKEAADAYLEAAAAVDGQLALELRRRACEQLLISGHVEHGLKVADELMVALGWSRPKTPRAIVASMLVQRAKLALRGTRFRERAESELDAALLTRVDLCWSLSTGMAIVDSKLGADFNARYVLLALRSGEPRRISRALALEAAQSSSTGAMDRAERFLGIADELAHRSRDPHCIGLVRLMRGFARYFAGRWREALSEFDAGLDIFRNECTGVTWETTTSQAFAMWSLLYLGDWAELVRRGPALLAEAQQRNNLYWAHSLSMSYGIVSRLMIDDPEGARTIHQTAARSWPSRGFQIQTFLETYMGGWIDLYAGSAERSGAHIAAIWPEARGSLLLSVHDVRLRMLHIRAYTALADRSPQGMSKRLAQVRKDAKAIEGLPSKGAAGIARIAEAGVMLQSGKFADAQRCLEQALATFAAAEMPLYAAAANRRLGELVGGDAGAVRVNEADALMRAAGVKRPEHMARVLAPIDVPGPLRAAAGTQGVSAKQ